MKNDRPATVYVIEPGAFPDPRLVTFGYRDFSYVQTLEWGRHRGPELTFMVDGGVCWELEHGETHSLVGNHVSIIASGIRHRAKDNLQSPSRMYWLRLSPWNDDLPPLNDHDRWRWQLLDRSGVWPMNRFSLALLKRAGELLASQANHPAPASLAHLAALLDTLLHEICLIIHNAEQPNPSPSVQSYIQAACNYIDSRLPAPVTVSELADVLGLSKSYTQRIFKESTGMRIQDYLQRKRLEYAGKCLRETDLTVAEIARRLHLSSGQYLSRLFRQYFGISPGAYRHRYRHPQE
ncbi:MAG: AraC family transcriptional regulator [Lentisphaerae bacterium]|nr:MAG: AraC family transcriptional regulator [Lentisphaerota bacterium]